MITWVRSAMIHDGKAVEGFAWATKVSTYAKETFDINISVLRNLSGHNSQVHWVATYDSLADMETTMLKLEVDASY